MFEFPPTAVSRSESQQEKALVVLNHEWQQIGSLPLDIGPRHFNIAEQHEISSFDLRQGDRYEMGGWELHLTLSETLNSSFCLQSTLMLDAGFH